MAVIRNAAKAHQPGFFSIKDAEEEARKIIADARAEAVHILESAQAEGFAQGQSAGYETGLSEGRAAGRAQAIEEYSEKIALAAEAITKAQSDFDTAQEEFTSSVLRDCIELALAVARRITKRQAQIDPDVLTANLEHAVKLITGSKSFRIAFHPHDRDSLEAALDHLKLTYHVLDDAKLLEDVTLSRGGCRIYTESGMIDADIEAQLDRLIGEVLPDHREPS